MVFASLAILGDSALFASAQSPYGPLVTVQGTMAQPAGLKLGAPLSPSARVVGALSFAGTNPAGQARLAEEINDHSSPLYQHYLVGNQFDQLFAPSTAMQADLTSYLESYGITVGVVDQYLWNLQGPASGMGTAFGTSFVSASSPGHSGYYPLVPPRLPSEFSGQVALDGGFQTVAPIALPDLVRAPTFLHSMPQGASLSPNAMGLTLNMTSPYIVQYQRAGPVALPPTDMNLTWNLTIAGGTPPYSVSWHWGDGSIQSFTTNAAIYPNFHQYYVAGQADYCFSTFCGNISVWVTDGASNNATVKTALVPAISPIAAETFYNLLPLYKKGDTGQGTIIGLDEMCDPGYFNYTTDANTFSAMMGLPTFTSGTLNLTGSGSTSATCTTGYSGWSGETMLDIEWAHSMAPNATLDVDLSNIAMDEGDSTWNTLSNGVFIASNSWGGGAYNAVWTKAATQGQTYLTASGDCGELDLAGGSDHPADNVNGVGVGGTQIYPYPSGVFRAEFAWNGTDDPTCTQTGANDAGSGGGYSTSITAPWYQVGMAGFSNAHRGVPDISAIGGTWVWMVDEGITISAGTSLACPSSAAMLDLMYQYNATANKGNGMAGKDFYDIAKSPDYHIGFHDIVVGNNKVGTAGYLTTPGWDPVTGLGSFNASQMAELMAEWNGNPSAVSTLTAVITANVTFGPANLAVNFGADVAGGTSSLTGYSYDWSFGDGGTATTSAYQTEYVYTTPGIYQASVTVSAPSSPSGTSNSIMVHVTGKGGTASILTSLTVAPTSASVPVGGTQNFTATPGCTPGPCPAGVAYTWSLSNALGTLSSVTSSSSTFTAGTATGEDTLYVNASLNGINVQGTPVPITINPALEAVTVTPAIATVAINGAIGLQANATCTGGTCPAGVTYAWTLSSTTMGTLSSTSTSSTTFTAATTTGTVNLFVNASLNGATMSAPVVPVKIVTSIISLSAVAVSPLSATLPLGGIETFSANATCMNGSVSAVCPSGITYAWSLTRSLGTLGTPSASSTTFTAGVTAGTIGIFVNATLNGVAKSGMAHVIISAGAVLVGVTVTPASISLSSGTSQTFTAAPTCSLGKCPSGVSYSWTLNNTLGNLSSSIGVSTTLTALSTPGLVGLTVTATLNGSSIHATALVTITASTSSGQGSSLWLWLIVIVVVVVVAAVVAVVLLLRRRKRSAAPPPPPPWQPPPQYGYQGPPQAGPYTPPPPGQAPPPPPE